MYHHAGLTFLADHPYRRGQADDVLGVGPSGLILANLTPRRSVELALDLGCGCGLQALLAARHANRVIATDINRRALTAIAANAKRNQISNIEIRQGDLFEPVKGLQFDLIACNPPYVVSPDRRFLYRDGGWDGGGICQRVLKRLPSHLSVGGFGVVHCQWPVGRHEDWWDTPRRWTEGTGVDVWLIGHGVAEPGAYASTWLGPQASNSKPSAGSIRRWTRWYRRHGIVGIGSGVLILRRRRGRNWQRAIHAPRSPSGPCSEQVTRIFDAQTNLVDDAEYMTSADQFARFSPGTSIQDRDLNDPTAPTCAVSEPDIGWNIIVGPGTRRVLLACDGRRRLTELVETTAGRVGGRHEQSREEIWAELRQLYGSGLLVLGQRE